MKKVALILIAISLIVSCKKDVVNPKIDKPIIDAGNNISNINKFEIQLNASEINSDEKGVWTVASGLIDDKVYFENKSDPKTIFHGLPGEEYKLVWTVTLNKEIANDTITVSFAPLQTQIINYSPDFYKTRLLLYAKVFDKGTWTFEGNYHHIRNASFGGVILPDLQSPFIFFYGRENSYCKLTWTTWYGSKSASVSLEFNSGQYQQDEALEDLGILRYPSYYEKDENGNVISIDLGGDWYGGRFEYLQEYPAIPALVHLKKLNLRADGFYKFPEVIADNFKQLEYLNFEDNAISSLPENIGNLINLDTLILRFNQDNKVLSSLPESFGQLTSLRYLDLQGMEINNLPESFSNLVNLKYLNLYDNFINNLPENFGNLKSLETFYGPTLKKNIPNSFSKLEKLKNFEIFIYSGEAILPDDFGQLKKLENLCLYGEFHQLPASFGDLTNLKKLEITNGSELSQLPENFGNLSNLEEVKIAGNFTSLPSTFSNLSNLKYLTLFGFLEYLPNDIGNLKKLEALTIDGMNLKEIPESFGNLESLKYFSAYSNHISVIPESFGNLSSIYELNLGNNNISHFPASMSNLSNTLSKFYIYGNTYSKEELNNLRLMLPFTRIYTE
jgi:Leucine-rich repeat (LRR) protein